MVALLHPLAREWLRGIGRCRKGYKKQTKITVIIWSQEGHKIMKMFSAETQASFLHRPLETLLCLLIGRMTRSRLLMVLVKCS